MSKRIAVARKPPVHIPLTFDQAIGGLLAVNPKQLPAKKAAVKKRPARAAKKKAAKKRG